LPSFRPILASVVLLLLAGSPPASRADGPIPFARVAPLLQKHCVGCHGPTTAKGDLRIDRLDPDLVRGKDGERWHEVLNRLNFGDMPPAKAPPLAREDRDLLTGWLVQERRRAALAKNPATHFRRLTRREYERTLQALLSLPIEFGTKLPEDGRAKDGFRNDGDALRISPLQYETYLQIADEALAEAIVTGPAPAVHRYRLSVGDRHSQYEITPLPTPADRPGPSFEYVTSKGKAYRIWNLSAPVKEWDGTLTPAAIRRYSEAAVRLPESCFAFGFHQAFRKGATRLKVRVARVPPADGADPSRLPVLTVAVGSTNFHGVELRTIGEPVLIDHADFRTYEFRVRMENVSVPNTGPLKDNNAAVVAAWNSARAIKGEAKPPRLKIEWLEFESPYLEAWPPASHTSILFPNTGLAEPAYAREVVRRFATRAYRAPLAPAELDRLMDYWAQSRKEADSFEASIRATLGVVLGSPRFLGLPAARASGKKERLTDHELASRLSYFLWSTMPDDELFRLAEQSKLRDPAVLSAQVRRLIQSPDSWQFIEQFAEQWLELERLQRVVVNRNHYPGFDDALAAAMRLETLHFFGEVLRGEHSIFQFLASDFTCLNETLAIHYGIPGVTGPRFRKVKLDPAQHRGGILTHASVLAGNSDGADGHPIKRGVWLLRNLLDETPPPPPPNVPELNRESPRVKNLTIPQALALHRQNASCAGCHRRIDPWGLAFEEYDAVGNWQRDGLGAELRKRRTRHPVDARAELPTGAKVDGLRELREELLRSRADDFRRALLRKVMAYALGRTLTLADVEAADALVPALRARGDRLATLIELIVASEPFQWK
jgi:mono/diheme cytochrome c family protein